MRAHELVLRVDLCCVCLLRAIFAYLRAVGACLCAELAQMRAHERVLRANRRNPLN